MSFDKRKTLQELEGINLEEQPFGSSLVTTVYNVYRKPLCELTVEDLRLMIGQNIGLHYLIPLALEELENNPFACGDYYPGDLMHSVLTADKDFWETHQELYLRVSELVIGLPSIMQTLIETIENFCADRSSGGQYGNNGRVEKNM